MRVTSFTKKSGELRFAVLEMTDGKHNWINFVLSAAGGGKYKAGSDPDRQHSSVDVVNDCGVFDKCFTDT